jgi:gliding motility-associated-like protein
LEQITCFFTNFANYSKYLNLKFNIRFQLGLLLILSTFTLSQKVHAQCGNTDFTVSKNLFCVPSIVQFSIQNLPSGATVAWDFGNGALSGNQSPSRLYDSAADYTVSLTITYVNNSTCVITKPNFIQAKPKPIINVVWDKSLMCFGSDTVTFQDNSLKIKKRDYLIDGVMFPNAPSTFKHEMDSPYGQKSAHIFVEDSFGCTNFQAFDTVLFLFDSLKFDFDKLNSNICMPSQTSFFVEIDTQEHQISSLAWSFPGGSPNSSSSISPTITYNTGGTYDVSLTVNNAHGCSYSLTKPSLVIGLDSIIPIISVNRSTICAGEIVTFTMTNNTTNQITWDFGSVKHQKISQSGNNIQVTFRETGIFGVTVTHDNNGCISSKTFNNQVTVNGPVADFNVPVNRSCKLPDTLKAVYINNGNPVLQWYWEVQKQPNTVVYTSTSNDSISFPLAERGLYSIKLKVTGNNGCSDSITKSNVINMDTINPAIAINPQPACVGQTVSISSITPEGKTGIVNKFEWTLFAKDDVTVLKTDTMDVFSYSFPDTGNYSVRVKVYNNIGCTGSTLYKDTVNIANPVLNFTISDSLPCRRDSILLNSNFPTDGDFANYSKRWIISHKDTNLIITRNGDSTWFVPQVPGIYDVKFTSMAPGGICRDTTTLPFRIKVSGTLLQIKADNLEGCNPLTVNWEALLIRSANYKNGLVNHQYAWKHSRPNDVTFTPPDWINTQAVYTRNGDQRTRFVVTHTSGCHDSISSSLFSVGVNASFSAGGWKCLKYAFPSNNLSSNNSSGFKWKVDVPGAVSFIPNDTAKSPLIKANQTGDYSITLIVYGQGGCTDTMTQIIRVINPSANFSSPDSVQYCAPVLATFTPTPVQYAINYQWHFGDGKTANTYSPVKVSNFYTKNTDSTGIDVTLIVRTLGCYDTITKPGYMKIIGPLPMYDFSPKIGCEPLKVNFQNQSKNFRQFYFDYGDGNIIDSTEFKEYTYTVLDKGMNVQVYKTKLLLLDDNGCYATYESPDSIIVRKNAEPNFTVSDTVSCEPFKVNFVNISLFSQDFWWDFEGDGIINTQEAGPSFTFKAGLYKPRLIARNGNGCMDTLQKYTLHVNPKPKAGFFPEADSVCFDSPLKFINQSTSPHKFNRFYWDFGNPSLINDTSTQRNPTYSFLKAYQNLVTLVATDSNNCKDTFSRFVYVYDTIPPLNTGINYITIANNKDIFVNWKMSPLGNFTEYTLYEDAAGYTQVYNSTNKFDTTYLVNSGININNQRYCYVTKVEDSCGNVSEFSKSHCTVEFWVEKNTSSSLRLKWLSYVGWNSVHSYIIYRSENSGPFIAYDTVSGNVLEYLDRQLCDRYYCYYVEAVHANRIWKSTSNRDCDRPDYFYPTTSIEPIRATVTSDNKVLVEWFPFKEMDNINHYIIDRFNHSTGSLTKNYDTAQTYRFVDDKVNVNETSYSYYIRPIDNCSFIAPISKQMRSIKLVNAMVNYNSSLSWNEYEEWPEGVLKYVVEMEGADGQFYKVGETEPNTLSFLFEDINVDENRSICFRVYAVRDQKNEDTSFSNIYCVIPESQVFIPNAFSPNGDGLNDEFKPRAIYLHNQTGDYMYDYKMYIYNKWGQQIFYSNDIRKGWDGYFNSKICPTDIYIYKINAVGLDGRVFDFKGTVHLLR